MSRLPLSRLAKIGAWTGAAVAWGSAMVMAKEVAPTAESTTTTAPMTQTADASYGSASTVPAIPNDGLVILRYKPIPEPEPEVVTRVVTVPVARSPSSTSGGTPPVATTAPPAASPSPSPTTATTTQTTNPPPPPPPTTTTTAPAPPSSGS